MKQNVLLEPPVITTAEDAAELVSVELAKSWIKIPADITTDDDLILLLIKDAREKIENYCGVSLAVHEIQIRVQIQTDKPYFLPYPPIAEIDEVTDNDDNILELETNYQVHGIAAKDISLSPCGDFTVSYSTTAATDSAWKVLLLKQIAWQYENRGDVQESRTAPGIARELKAKKLNWL